MLEKSRPGMAEMSTGPCCPYQVYGGHDWSTAVYFPPELGVASEPFPVKPLKLLTTKGRGQPRGRGLWVASSGD